MRKTFAGRPPAADVKPPAAPLLRRKTGSSWRTRPWTVSGVLCARRKADFPGPRRTARRVAPVLEEACGGDELVFYAAWNRLVAEGATAASAACADRIRTEAAHRRPVAIVPRVQLTPQLAEGRIVLDLGDDRFWLLPRDLADRTLLFTMRHGISRVESKTHRVGQRLSNQLDEERGVPRADAVGSALARMVGVVGQQLDFLHLTNYLDPRRFLHFISHSPNTRQLYQRVVVALSPASDSHPEPMFEHALESSDFGWITGVAKGHGD